MRMEAKQFDLSDGWTVKWSNIALSGEPKFIGLFSGPFQMANQIYSVDDIKDVVTKLNYRYGAAPRVPVYILAEALELLNKTDEVAANAA